jgi:hypothetical protein
MGTVTSVAAIASFTLLAAMEALAGRVVMDFTSALRSEGALTQERWDRLIDDMAPHLHAAFRIGTAIPVLLMLLAMAQFLVAWRAGARRAAAP